jgi:DUF1365 family protein
MNSPARLPLLGVGQVIHKRLAPVHHAFRYPTYFLYLPMRSLVEGRSSLSGCAWNRFGVMSFHDADHGLGEQEQGSALRWLDTVLHAAGIHDADGECWLHTYPRVWGYAFKPVSFWYCHRRDGRIRAVVAEVNNTFGERHCYLLDTPNFSNGSSYHAAKVFHVSPFCSVEGEYRFRFMQTGERTLARIDYADAQGLLLQTSVSGRLHLLTPRLIREVLWRYPWMTLLVWLRIHVQAFRLWRKKLIFFRKPSPPQDFVT